MLNTPLTKLPQAFIVSVKEQRLIEELRKVPYGKVEVTMLEGQPDRIEKIKESIKL